MVKLCVREMRFVLIKFTFVSYEPGPASGELVTAMCTACHWSRVDCGKGTLGVFFTSVVGSRASSGGGT